MSEAVQAGRREVVIDRDEIAVLPVTTEDDGRWTILDCELGRRMLDQVNHRMKKADFLHSSGADLQGFPAPGEWVSLNPVYRVGRQ